MLLEFARILKSEKQKREMKKENKYLYDTSSYNKNSQKFTEINFVNEGGRKTHRKTRKKEKTSKIQKTRKKMKNVYVKIT